MEEEFNRDQANDVELVSDFAGERFPCGAGGMLSSRHLKILIR